MEMKKSNYQAKPAYQSNQGSQVRTNVGGGDAAVKSNLKKISGLFKTEQGKGFEVKVTAEILSALSSISVGDFLKVYENQSQKDGTPYLSLNVKPAKIKA
jgi:hypothetical protein